MAAGLTITIASKSGGVAVTYTHDALGRRVQRTSTTGGTTKFVYDGADVIRDLDSPGSIVAEYLNGPGIDNNLRMTTGGVVSYFVTDHLGSTRALTDASGIVTSTLNYDSFGNLTGGSVSTRYTYTGREIDSETGLMYYRARWYDAQQGRFIREDPIGLDAGINFFAYVANDSMNSRDPLGLKKRTQHLASRRPTPAHSCSCETKEPAGEDDSFFSLMGSYSIGAVNGFTGAALGTAELPIDLVNDPSGTVDGILIDIGMRIWTLGQIVAHPVLGSDAIIDSIATLGANKTMEVLEMLADRWSSLRVWAKSPRRPGMEESLKLVRIAALHRLAIERVTPSAGGRITTDVLLDPMEGLFQEDR